MINFNATERINSIINANELFNKAKQKPAVSEGEIDRIADMLVTKLGYPESRRYYCKVARLLDSNTLERLAVSALEVGAHPGKLFTYLTKKDIAKMHRGEPI